jgi:uncharacterized protein (DUF2141 family)
MIAGKTLNRFLALPLLCCALSTTCTMRTAAQAQMPRPSPEATSTLTVRITGIRNANGNLQVKLSRDTNVVELRAVEIEAKTLTAQTVFARLPYGAYAVSLFHDENKNGKLDSNLLRIPKEGYGFSNNPSKRVGQPKYEETTFILNQPQQATEIKLVYW